MGSAVASVSDVIQAVFRKTVKQKVRNQSNWSLDSKGELHTVLHATFNCLEVSGKPYLDARGRMVKLFHLVCWQD